MRRRGPTKPQVVAIAWAIYRGGGMLRSIDFGYLEIRDATVAALEAAGWADRVAFYDNAAKWRWHWFYVTNAARGLASVIAEVDRLRAADLLIAQRSIAEDDATMLGGDS